MYQNFNVAIKRQTLDKILMNQNFNVAIKRYKILIISPFFPSYPGEFLLVLQVHEHSRNEELVPLHSGGLAQLHIVPHHSLYSCDIVLKNNG